MLAQERSRLCVLNSNQMKVLAATAILGFLGLKAAAGPIELGAPIPDISGTNQAGQTISFREAGARGYLLVYFYPKADTPGCTAQACSLRDAYEDLQKKGVKVLGVSADVMEAQKKFQEKYRLPFDLIAGADGKAISAFGVPRIPVIGLAARQAFLFRDGKLIWRDLHAATKKQAEDVLKVLAGEK